MPGKLLTYLADQGQAKGWSTKIVVNNLLTESSSSSAKGEQGTAELCTNTVWKQTNALCF